MKKSSLQSQTCLLKLIQPCRQKVPPSLKKTAKALEQKKSVLEDVLLLGPGALPNFRLHFIEIFRGFLWIRRSEKPSGTLHLELILSLATLEEGPNANYATGNVRTCALSAVRDPLVYCCKYLDCGALVWNGQVL